jgi:uncharacterized Tic20 family protein
LNTSASSDEKIMASLAHGSVIMAFVGPIVPVIIWSTQRKKSKFVAFHALQAMGYQIFTFWLWMIAMILLIPLATLLMPLSIAVTANSSNAGMTPFIFQLVLFIAIFGLMGLFFLTGIVGAIFCLTGRDFRYPVMGKWLEKYLSYGRDVESPLDETQEDNWVAGICHAMAILQLWGVVTPLIVWFTQKERSIRLRFQSMQAFVYQIIAFVLYMLGMVVYMAFFIGMFLTLILGGTTGGSNELQGPPALMMVGFFAVMIIFWFIMLIVMPIYYLLAGLAGVRVIRGHQFRYPILGRIIEKRMGSSQSLETTA